MGWNYSGPAEAEVEEIDKSYYKPLVEFGEEYREEVRKLCREALELDEACYPAHAALGYFNHFEENWEGMMEHYLKTIELCDRPLDSDLLMETIFVGLYEESSVKPLVWPYIVTLWEKIQEKQPRFKSLRSICIACRFSGDPRIAHEALDDWQREHPEDSTKLAKLALKNLKDPRKAADILETRIADDPSDRKAERFLKRVNKRLN